LTENEVVEIDLRKLLQAVLRRWWIIVLALVIGAGGAFAVTRFLMTPLYSATIKLYVNNTTESAKSITSSDITASKSLVETYITIIRSDAVLGEVIDRTSAGYTVKELDEKLTAGALNSTEVFYMTITTPDPVLSAALANAIAETAPAHLAEIVDGSSVKVVDKAKVPTEPSSPSFAKNTAIGALAGVFLSGAVIVMIVVFDVRIMSENDLQMISELPVLGAITDFGSAGKSGYGYAEIAGHTKNDQNKKERKKKEPAKTDRTQEIQEIQEVEEVRERVRAAE
jgi:capsular polysaccharide biosynthesis protein